ncbi:MAG TPA: hypothetical protein VNX47_05945 [Nevskia sp.]|jgi:hypothetical protein|nr:hypothetical protein [Nevskia sp.]
MLADLYADFYTRNPNADLSETDDYDEELAEFLRENNIKDI